jgi:hypothetical protein
MANLVAKVTTFFKLPLNRSHITSLRIKDVDVSKIVEEFKQRTTDLKIPLVIFYELLPEKFGIFKRHVSYSKLEQRKHPNLVPR